jgi:hypothetical protein
VELLCACLVYPEGWATRAIAVICRRRHWTRYYKLIKQLNTIFALNTENKVVAGPKQLRRLRPFAGSKTRALILLLPRVATAQRDLCVITVNLNQ